jgi:hypothetical protein
MVVLATWLAVAVQLQQDNGLPLHGRADGCALGNSRHLLSEELMPKGPSGQKRKADVIGNAGSWDSL